MKNEEKDNPKVEKVSPEVIDNSDINLVDAQCCHLNSDYVNKVLDEDSCKVLAGIESPKNDDAIDIVNEMNSMKNTCSMKNVHNRLSKHRFSVRKRFVEVQNISVRKQQDIRELIRKKNQNIDKKVKNDEKVLKDEKIPQNDSIDSNITRENKSDMYTLTVPR